MLKLCTVTKVKVFFLVLVHVFNLNLFEFLAAIIFGEGSISREVGGFQAKKKPWLGYHLCSGVFTNPTYVSVTLRALPNKVTNTCEQEEIIFWT